MTPSCDFLLNKHATLIVIEGYQCSDDPIHNHIEEMQEAVALDPSHCSHIRGSIWHPKYGTLACFQRGLIGVERFENVQCNDLGNILQVSLHQTSVSVLICSPWRVGHYSERQSIPHKSPWRNNHDGQNQPNNTFRNLRSIAFLWLYICGALSCRIRHKVGKISYLFIPLPL